MEATRWRSIPFVVVCALIVAAAAYSLHLELRIRRAETTAVAMVVRVPAVAAPTAAPANQPVAAEAGGWSSRGRWLWQIDEAAVRAEIRKNAAAIQVDQDHFRATAYQVKVRSRFHELYRILNLAPDEIARFEETAAKQGLIFAGLVTTDPADEIRHQQFQARAMDAVVAQALGMDYVEPFRAFLYTSDLRNVTADLGAHALAAGEPLDPAQAEALLQASVAASELRDGDVRLRVDGVDWDAVAARAEKLLTPGQLATWRALIDRQRFDRTYKEITGLPLRRPLRGL